MHAVNNCSLAAGRKQNNNDKMIMLKMCFDQTFKLTTETLDKYIEAFSPMVEIQRCLTTIDTS